MARASRAEVRGQEVRDPRDDDHEDEVEEQLAESARGVGSTPESVGRGLGAATAGLERPGRRPTGSDTSCSFGKERTSWP
jgi:hypothetical protein